MKQYYVYIMTNFTNTTLYVGVTNNVARRAFEHKAKLIPGFTKRYNLNKLIYFEVFKDIKEAITREKTLKNLVRRKKDELINNNNPEWKDLFDEIV
ncbi:GIY-YIG nuclease family protein [Patescibacteria group bacterium]|nr:GIY-YIG nuclease family protein [Patescibacteria group bacterium]